MFVLVVLLALVFVGDTLLVRVRLAEYGRLGGGEGEAAVFNAPGVEAPTAGVGAYLDAHALDLVYLAPERVDAQFAWRMAHAVDVKAMQSSPIWLGVSTGHAFGLRPEIAARAGYAPRESLVAHARMARDAKAYVGRRVGVAIVPGATQVGAPFRDKAFLTAVFDNLVNLTLVGPPLTWAALVGCLVAAPWYGLFLVALYLLQFPAGLAGSPFAVTDLARASLMRPIDEAREWWRALRAPGHPADEPDPVESRRAWYDEQIAQGIGRFRGPKAEACYVCGGASLAHHLTVPDLFQGKPGTFDISRCADCGHLFQDPQLTVEGLNFYYRDFYDGLQAGEAERSFVTPILPYASRTESVTRVIDPKTWLDVGCGHGHWCRMAAEQLPDCRFEGLDQSDGVDTALQRGWIAEAHHGLFPALAPTLNRTYDVVSMSHYLEHTVDPRAELSAASRLLEPGGCLSIEVPDPSGPWARLLRGAWLPWLQPQHLHLLSPKNLERLLREAGFEPVEWLFGEAHHQHDLSVGVYLFARRFAPRLRVPWRPEPGALDYLRTGLVFGVAGPLMILCGLLDVLLAVPARKFDWTSTMRVVSRKVDP